MSSPQPVPVARQEASIEGPGASGTRQPAQPGTGWGCADRPLLELHDVLLLDLDGVVYVGEHAVRGAAGVLAGARAAGVRLAFVTNNASRTSATVAEHLNGVGVEAKAQDVITSAQAAASMLAKQLPGGSRVLVVGGAGLREALTEIGLTPVGSADEQPAAVVQGFAPEVGWAMLTEACVAVRAGLPWVATNPDVTLPTARGLAPGNGALVDVVRRTTGAEPTVAGKPFRPILDEAVRRTGARRALLVGDRLDTDIQGANTAGVPSMLVLTGITGVHALLDAPPSMRPTYVAAGIEGVEQAQPAVILQDGWWRCGQVRARLFQGRLELQPASASGDGAEQALDALRVACSAFWSAGEDADLSQAARALAPWSAPHGWDR